MNKPVASIREHGKAELIGNFKLANINNAAIVLETRLGNINCWSIVSLYC